MSKYRTVILLTAGLLAIVMLPAAGNRLLAAPAPPNSQPLLPLAPLAQIQSVGAGEIQLQIEATATVTPTTTPVPTIGMPNTVDASSGVDTVDWISPANLSRSGATEAPQIVVDSNGRFHALWRDAIDGFAYAIGDGFGWSDPVVVETPFSTRRYFPDLEPEDPTPRFQPYLVADTRSNIHAFWVESGERDERILYHSQVAAGQFNNIDAWSARQALDSGSASPVAVADLVGQVHLAYIRAQEVGGQRAGIYYQRINNGSFWSGPQTIYASRYLRSLGTAEGTVDIAVSPDEQVTVAWDDPGREQVFVARSANGGQTWSVPTEIDRRSDADSRDARGPAGIAVGTMLGSTVVTWGAGHESGRDCTQYYRSYNAADGSWSASQPVDELPDCLDSAQFLTDGTALYLLGTIGEESAQQLTAPTISTYILAWNGSRWGLAEAQQALSTFANPDTSQPLALGCQRGLIRDGRLHLVACDLGVGQDSWSSSRALGEAATWFPPPPVWHGPDRVTGSELFPQDLQLVADAAGNTHAMWHTGQDGEIFHMLWDGQDWSSAFPVITAPQGEIEQFAAASFADRLYLVGRDEQGLFFAEANTLRPTEWSAPSRIDVAPAYAIAPYILADNSGILLAYAVALNEQRGIYLTRSADMGRTWSQPVVAFDGTAASWDMVGQPQLAKTEGGELHLTWMRHSLPPEAAPLSLAYSRSMDDGFTWREAEELISTPVMWSRLFGHGDRVLHRLWVAPTNGRHVVWHAVSIDDGLTWGANAQVTALEAGELPAATLDPAGRLHVLALNGGRLLNWAWDGATWTSDESLRTMLADGGSLGAAADIAGRLVTLYADPMPGTVPETSGVNMHAMWRPLALSDFALPAPPALTPTPGATATSRPAPTVAPTPTLVIPTAVDGGPLSRIPGANSQVGQLAIAVIPAGLVVLLVTVIGLRATRMGRK